MSGFIDKVTPANLITIFVLVSGLVGTFYLSLDKIESHEQRINRLEVSYNEFLVQYARKVAEEDAQDKYLELQIEHLMEK